MADLDVLRELIARLDARLVPSDVAKLHRVPLMSPDGSELTDAQALGYRAVAFTAAAEVWLEMQPSERPAPWLPDFERIPMWARVSLFAVAVGFPVMQAMGLVVGLLMLARL